MQNKGDDLCKYRINAALETLDTAKTCLEIKHYKMLLTEVIMLHFMQLKLC